MSALKVILLIATFVAFVSTHGGMEDDVYEHKYTSGDFKARWVINGESVTFTVSAPTMGWIGIGFAPIGDTKSVDFIVAVTADNSVSDMIVLNGETVAKLDTDAAVGGTNNIVEPKNNNDGATTTFEFTRKLNTGDDKGDHILADGKMLLKWAYDGDTTANKGKIDVANHGEAELNFFEIPLSSEEMKLIRYHGAIMCTFIMIVMTASLITVRYLKNVLWWWVYLHFILTVVGWAFFIIALVLVFKAHGDKFIPSWHSAFGVIFIIFMSLQTLLGLVAHFKFDKFRSGPPLFPDKIHWWLGRITYFLGLLNITIGLAYVGEFSGLGWFLYALWYALVAIMIFALQRNFGQTHETFNGGHKLLDGGVESSAEGNNKKNLKQQRKSAEYLVMFFVPISTAIFAVYLGVSVLI